ANVVGGYVVTDRMLQMFRKKPVAPAKTTPGEGESMPQGWLYTILSPAWLTGAAMFVLGLHQMTSPAPARGGNRLSAAGMTIAVGTTLLYLATRPEGLPASAWAIIVVGFVIGGGAGLSMARRVQMTAMPQLVSLFNA